jgi:hypothetical protein
MKHIILALIVLASTYSFGQTGKETQKIEEEILAITQKYNQTWETIDMLKVSQFHSDSSFRYCRNMRIGVSSNEEFKKLLPVYMSGVKSWKIEVSTPTIQVLSENVAVISFTGKAELTTKENKVSDEGTGAYTYVWQKINGQWRIVHIHESTK